MLQYQVLTEAGMVGKGIQPESLAVKEIKTKAFEMSEEKWWDCRKVLSDLFYAHLLTHNREEITALEDEQEEKGIGETINLAERGDAGGVGRRR